MADVMGLQGAYGIASLQDNVRQQIKDRLDQEMAAREMAIREADLTLRQREAAQRDLLLQAQLMDKIQTQREGIASKAAPMLGMDTPVTAQDFQRIYSGTSEAPNFSPQMSLAGRRISPDASLPTGAASTLAPSSADTVSPPAADTSMSAVPQIPTGQQVFSGTPQQRELSQHEAIRQRLLNDPTIAPAYRGYLQILPALEKGQTPPPIPQPSAGAEDAQYQNIVARQIQGLPVSDQEQAMKRAYEQRKTLGVDTSAAAAAARMANAQDATNARLDRTQNFQEQQVGRNELTNKVEQPYRDAHTQAETLRDVVAQAQAGNKIAASMQNLETTLAAIRAGGLNRINTVELGVPATAGTLWDRIVGRLGKLDAGQPVPPDLQKDMLGFADVLDKAAYRKYIAAHTAVTKRYKLTDEQPLPAPVPATTTSTNRVYYDANGNPIKK